MARLNLCKRCAAIDCRLPNKGNAESCPYFADEGTPFPIQKHVNERTIAEHQHSLKEQGFFANREDGPSIRAKADKKVKKVGDKT
jgi:hypothetical protein